MGYTGRLERGSGLVMSRVRQEIEVPARSLRAYARECGLEENDPAMVFADAAATQVLNL